MHKQNTLTLTDKQNIWFLAMENFKRHSNIEPYICFINTTKIFLVNTTLHLKFLGKIEFHMIIELSGH